MDKEKKPIIIETADIYLHFPYIMEEEADNLADFLEEEHIEYEGATDIFIDLQNQVKKQKEVIDRKKYLLKEQGTELKELYSEIDKLQGRIDKAIEYLEEPNRDSFDYSKAILLDILKEVSE